MLIVDILSSALIAISFFTFFPVPKLDFTERRMKYVPLMMPLVGLINGLLAFLLFGFLSDLNFSSLLKAVILCLYFVVFTGGLHIDGLMDSADAYFSRQPKEKKLEIMKDTSVGAFAVITIIFVILLKIAILFELFKKDYNYSIIIFIPIISRILQSSMLYLFPAAKKEGLARMYGNLDKRYSLILLVFLLLSAVIEIKALLLFAVVFLYFIFFYFSSKKQFGGITGDLLGAFLEISELIMFGVLLFI